MDQAGYVQAARAVQEANMAKIGRRYLGSRRTIRLLAEMARQIETELRSLDPPAEDAAAIEEHFIRPWSEYARFLSAMADARAPRLLGPTGTRRFLAEAPGAPRDRQEDIDFCNAYGLGDPDT
ncbi:MAG: hypothetical protein ABSA91_06615 [Acidimicrobiales bacterium]